MEYQPKKIPWLMILGFVLIFGVGLGYGYYYSQNSYVTEQLDTVDREIAEAQNQIGNLGASETVSAQRALEAISTINASEVLWSDVLSIIVKVVPNDPTAKQKFITFTSFSGSEGGRLTFNGHTIPSTNIRKQLEDIADTIDAFNEVPEFSDAFVPSISKSVNEQEETVLSIIFNSNYIPQATTAAAEESPASTEDGGEVPRT